MIIWDAVTNHKMQGAKGLELTFGAHPTQSYAPVITLRSPTTWVMTCAFERTRNALVACGGLDNLCTIYNIGGLAGLASAPPATVVVSAMGTYDHV